MGLQAGSLPGTLTAEKKEEARWEGRPMDHPVPLYKQLSLMGCSFPKVTT